MSNLNRYALDNIRSDIQTFRAEKAAFCRTDALPWLQVDKCSRLGRNPIPPGITILKPLVIHNNPLFRAIGLLGSVASYIHGKNTISLISVCLMLTYVLQKAVFVRLKTRCLCWTQVLLLGGCLRIVNIVPFDSKIVNACWRGDLAMVRQLLESGHATPDDVTPDGNSVLYVRSFAVPEENNLLKCHIESSLLQMAISQSSSV